MPRYFQDDEKQQRNGFESFDELTHFLTKIKPDDWQKVRTIAHGYLTGKHVPQRKLKKQSLYKIITSPSGHHLLPSLHHELHQHYDQEDIGGGIMETLTTIGTESLHLLGLDWLGRILGIVPKTKVNIKEYKTG